MNRRSGRHFLQIPGPTSVPERVLREIERGAAMRADPHSRRSDSNRGAHRD